MPEVREVKPTSDLATRSICCRETPELVLDWKTIKVSRQAETTLLVTFISAFVL
jgi:hypothetical protein